MNKLLGDLNFTDAFDRLTQMQITFEEWLRDLQSSVEEEMTLKQEIDGGFVAIGDCLILSCTDIPRNSA